MKVVTRNIKEFKPFDLTIEVETLEDLETLFHRFNISSNTVERGTDDVTDAGIVILGHKATECVYSTLVTKMKEEGVWKLN